MRLIDLSHVVEDRMITYPGLPGPELGSHLSFAESEGVYAPGTEFQIGRISMVTNTGTYLDTPAHRYRDGWDLSGLPLELCAALAILVVDAPASGVFDAGSFAGLDISGRAVILRSGWDASWGTPAYGDPVHPHLDPAGTAALVERGAALVGIDSVNIDDTTTGERPAHSGLLAAGIPVVEHLTRLDQVADGDLFFAVPVAVRGLATFPVRAFAMSTR